VTLLVTAVVASATLVTAGSAAGRGAASAPATEVTASSAAAITPSPDQVVQLGSTVAGECQIDDGRVDGRVASWEVASVIPAFKHGGEGGVELSPTADKLPRLAKGPAPPAGPFKGQWVLVPRIIGFALSGFGGCRIQSFDPLQALTLEEPGPHVFVQYYQSAHFRVVTDATYDVPAQPCARNDPDFPGPNGEIAPPPDPAEGTWVVDAFCNTTIVVGFYVASTSKCSSKADMSKWSGFPYVNQYDAGERLGLPRSGSDGRRGGNACGPSSLMMAMLAGGPGNLRTLPQTYDGTMERTAAEVAAAERTAAQAPPKKRKKALRKARGNKFSGPNAVAFLKSLGWRSARVHRLSANVEENERTILETMGGKGPVVVSTAFGTNRWGLTGGGHMVAIVGADRRGNIIVNDPAGNLFAAPRGHYGPGKCGYRAVYPHFWLLAHVTSRWMLELGKRTPPRRPYLAEPGKAFRPGDSAAILTARAAPRYGTAFSVLDAQPGPKGGPDSFYLRDAKGRRAGWIDGRAISEIPDSSVSQDPPGWTDPAAGDTSLAAPGVPGATPRALVVPLLERGTRLYVSARKGARYSLVAKTWQDGRVIATQTVRGTGTGDPTVVPVR
jgi:hypothetical protein